MRPRASDVSPPDAGDAREAQQRRDNKLTRAQAHALRRCAPLTPAQFKARRLLADQSINPLRARDARDTPRTGPQQG